MQAVKNSFITCYAPDVLFDGIVGLKNHFQIEKFDFVDTRAKTI